MLEIFVFTLRVCHCIILVTCPITQGDGIHKHNGVHQQLVIT